MKKLILGLGITILTLFSSFGAVSAKVNRVQGPWSLTAPKAMVFTCGGTEYKHTLDSVVNNTENGDFYGVGYYQVDKSYTWDITGNISGDSISFQLIYTGTNSGYTLNGTGTIAPDGSIQGTLSNGCESFSMAKGSAVRFTSNHGQWVRKGKDKLEAAHSRIGMPVATLVLKAPKSIAFTCDGLVYTHTLNSVENNLTTGDFTGTGTYNKDKSYGWNIVGNITGQSMTYQLVYTGTDAGYTLNGVGTIANNGSVSGTTDGNCQTFTMKPGSVVKNNGLKSSIINAGKVKKLSTKVKAGIPVQSRDNEVVEKVKKTK